MRKLVLIILGSLLLSLLSGCGKEDKISKTEQDRVARFIVNNIKLVDGEDIKTIEFLQFSKNTSTQIWRITVEINSRYEISLKENNLGEDISSFVYNDEEIVINKEEQTKNISDVKIIYYKGEEVYD